MSAGHHRNGSLNADATNSLQPFEQNPTPESPTLDDESLREENTLSACLRRILHSGPHLDTEVSLDTRFSSDIDQPGLSRFTDYRNFHSELAHSQVDCRRLNLPHCQRGEAALAQSGSSQDYSYIDYLDKESMADNREINGDNDKLKNWRAAGEALRKALAESGNKKKDGDGKPRKECLKVARGLCKKKDTAATGGQVQSDDPMNVMLDEYKSQENDSSKNDPLDDPRVTQSLLAGVESVIANSEVTHKEPTNQTGLSPGLVTVRERIQQITAKINHNQNTDNTADGIARKGHKYNRTTGLLHTRSSSIGHGSSSESEDEVETKRHKMFVPRCRRASSSGKLPKGSVGAEGSELFPEENQTKDKTDLTSIGADSQWAEGTSRTGVSGGGAAESAELLSDIDSQEDLVTQKLQQLARQQENNCISESDDPSILHFRPTYKSRLQSHLMSAETDSITNLADIESSLHSDENETLGESDLSEVRYADRRLIGGRDVDSGQEDEADSGSACPGWGSDADGNWSEQGTLKRNKERAQMLAESERKRAVGSDGEELGDIEDLVFDSTSDQDNEPVEISPDKLATLPDLVSDSSCASASDGDGEADDEFECDCAVCQQQKTRTEETEWVTDNEDDILGAVDRIEYFSNSSNLHPHAINLAELTPLDLLLMREGRRELLELMFQNVIMQMLSVYPDLLGEQAPPPAPPTTINDLPIVKIDPVEGVEDQTCPICLCNLEVGEDARELPCHHKFHGLCIQAWLHKSGTCPVCRHILSGPS